MASMSFPMARGVEIVSSRNFPSGSVRCGTDISSSLSIPASSSSVTFEHHCPGLALGVKREHKLRCECHDLYEDLVPYVNSWKWQKETVTRMCAELAREEKPTNTVILLQHPPVYTMGTRSSDEFLRFDKDHPPYELYRTERGGEITYHGPGQLVMYPILNLRDHKMDLHWYMRMLEEVVIRTLWSACGLEASRVDGLTGVWVGKVKVAAMGVRVSRWITYHGLALNVNMNLSPFQKIVPCGIADRPVGSIDQLLKEQELFQEHGLPLAQLNTAAVHETERQSHRVGMPSNTSENIVKQNAWTHSQLLRHVRDSLLVEFADLFQLQLVLPTREGPGTSLEVSVP